MNPFDSSNSSEEEKDMLFQINTQQHHTIPTNRGQPTSLYQQPYVNNTQHNNPQHNPDCQNYYAHPNDPFTNQHNQHPQYNQTATPHTHNTHKSVSTHNYFSKEQQLAQAHIDTGHPYTPRTNPPQEGQFTPQYTHINHKRRKTTQNIQAAPSNYMNQAHLHPYNHMPFNEQQYPTQYHPHTQYYNVPPQIIDHHDRRQYNNYEEHDEIRYTGNDDDDDDYDRRKDYRSSQKTPNHHNLKNRKSIDIRKGKNKLFR